MGSKKVNVSKDDVKSLSKKLFAFTKGLSENERSILVALLAADETEDAFVIAIDAKLKTNPKFIGACW